MGELVKVFERFLGRDLVFIFAGMIPLLSFGRVLWAAGCLPKLAVFDGLASLDQVSWVWIALSVGAAWVVGYAVQDLSCLTPLNSTAVEGEPGRIARWLFRLYLGREWRERDFTEFGGELIATMNLERSQNEAQRSQLERLVYLMQVGTAIGPGSVVGGVLLMLLWLPPYGVALDLIVGGALIIAGFALLALGALKRAQLREYVFEANRIRAGT